MTAKRTPFSYNVGTVYQGFLTGNFYHYTLTISFCLQVSMARMEKNWFLIILYTSHSVLFKSWIIKNDPNQMTLSFSFDIIIFWYPLFRVSDMNKDGWEYWVENCYSHRAFFCSLRPGDGGYGWPFVSKLWHDIRRFFVTYTCVLFPSIWPFSYKRAYICAQKIPYICVANKHVAYGVTESRRIRGTKLYRQQKAPSCTMELKSNCSLNQAWPQWPR